MRCRGHFHPTDPQNYRFTVEKCSFYHYSHSETPLEPCFSTGLLAGVSLHWSGQLEVKFDTQSMGGGRWLVVVMLSPRPIPLFLLLQSLSERRIGDTFYPEVENEAVALLRRCHLAVRHLRPHGGGSFIGSRSTATLRSPGDAVRTQDLCRRSCRLSEHLGLS